MTVRVTEHPDRISVLIGGGHDGPLSLASTGSWSPAEPILRPCEATPGRSGSTTRTRHATP